MLKPISRLRLLCKGNLGHKTKNTNPNSSHHGISCTMRLNRISRVIGKSIPILSIFAFSSVCIYATIIIGLGEVEGEVYAETINNNTSLIVDNGSITNGITTADGVTYSSHKVQIKADNISGYALTITGPASITNGTTNLSGAGGTTPDNMPANTWGYAWGAEADTEASMTYVSFTGGAQSITKTTDSTTNNPNVSSYKINFTRKLVFAAKFGDNATNGHYTGNVKLNLTITPRALTTYSITYNSNGGIGDTPSVQSYESSDTSTIMYLSDGSKFFKIGYTLIGWSTSSNATTIEYDIGSTIKLTSSNPTETLYAVWKQATAFPSSLTTMQGMTADICKNAGIGATKTLTDNRDNKTYQIAKLKDGNCWMLGNLALDLSVANIAKTTNSDVSSNFPSSALPNRYNTATTNAWVNDETLSEFSKAPAKKAVYYSWDDYHTEYGYYYSWCAATAGTCKNSSGTAIVNADAPSSICPKGWHLPRGGYPHKSSMPNRYVADITTMNGDDFLYLLNLDIGSKGATYRSGGSFISASGTTPAYFILGGINWYDAGYVMADEGMYFSGKYGQYWTRTAHNWLDTSANYLDLSENGNYSQLIISSNSKFTGLPIRCIAYAAS